MENQNRDIFDPLFLEWPYKKFSKNILQNHFYCIFKKEFFKKFQIFEIFRNPRPFGTRNTTFGDLRRSKVGGHSPASRKKIWGTTYRNRRI